MFKKISDALKWIGSHFLGLLFVLIVLMIIIPDNDGAIDNSNLQEIELKGP